MKKALILLTTLVFLMAGNAMAIDWMWAGDVFDQEIFDGNNDTSPIPYPDVPGNEPSPGGEIGEMFDLEGAKCGMDDNYLYFALTNSFGTGVMYDNFYYEIGDLFFGFNGSDATYGIDFTDGYIYQNTATPFGIPVTPGGYHNHPSIVNAVGPYAIDTQNSALLGQASGQDHLAQEVVMGDTHVIEIILEKSLFNIDFSTVNMISVRQTIACGNDLLLKSCPVNVVPEPGTLALLGLGLLGTGWIARRKK